MGFKLPSKVRAFECLYLNRKVRLLRFLVDGNVSLHLKLHMVSFISVTSFVIEFCYSKGGS